MDCFIGKNAARDVYPVVTAELDRLQLTDLIIDELSTLEQ